MYKDLVYTGQVDFRGRIEAVWGALGVLWCAICGWIVSGIDHPSGDVEDAAV